MKLDVMIVGIKGVGDGNTLELELVDLAVPKQKTDIMDTLLKGDFMGAVKGIKDVDTQYRHKVFVPKDWYGKHILQLYRSMTLEINPADKEKIAQEYK